MTHKTVGFLGGGRIARVFLGGWARAGAIPAEVVASDNDAQVVQRLQATFPMVNAVVGDNAAAMGQDVVFVALHPPAIADTLAAVRSALKPAAIVVSLAPKLTLAKLSVILGGFDRLARMIPNAPSIVGAGFNPVAFSPSLPEADRETIRQLVRPLGECHPTEEPKLEAFAVLTGMGPTYFWPMFYELLALGESFGLDRSECARGLRQMLSGAVATMLESGLDAAAVQDLVPVKPLADVEQATLEAYRAKLKAVFDKIKP